MLWLDISDTKRYSHHWLIDGEDEISTIFLLHLLCDCGTDFFFEQVLQVPECHNAKLRLTHVIPQAGQQQRQEHFKRNESARLSRHRFYARLIEATFPCGWCDYILHSHLTPLGEAEHFNTIVPSRKSTFEEKTRHIVSCFCHTSLTHSLLRHRA